jgi:iron-sulfur cluster assembly protein
MKDFLNISDSAIKQINQIINNAPQKVDGLLLSIDKSGCSGYSYKLDFAYQDKVKNYEFISKEGIKLYIEPKASLFLIGTEMDYQTDKLSSRFIFNNPKQKNTCGCGESFQL